MITRVSVLAKHSATYGAKAVVVVELSNGVSIRMLRSDLVDVLHTASRRVAYDVDAAGNRYNPRIPTLADLTAAGV